MFHAIWICQQKYCRETPQLRIKTYCFKALSKHKKENNGDLKDDSFQGQNNLSNVGYKIGPYHIIIIVCLQNQQKVLERVSELLRSTSRKQN